MWISTRTQLIHSAFPNSQSHGARAVGKSHEKFRAKDIFYGLRNQHRLWGDQIRNEGLSMLRSWTIIRENHNLSAGQGGALLLSLYVANLAYGLLPLMKDLSGPISLSKSSQSNADLNCQDRLGLFGSGTVVPGNYQHSWVIHKTCWKMHISLPRISDLG